MTKFYFKSNIKAQILIFLKRLKKLREKFLRVKFGKNAQLLICGKTIYKS